MAILLIGSTGNGKSTLGNFLINPEKDHIFGEQQTFKTARTNKPETQLVLSADFKVELEEVIHRSVSVIDTPGIFEDEDKDIEHMVNIIRALHDVGSIRAIILVVKFSSEINTPYKASIRYYSKLLPCLFETNLVIVMNDYACDKRSMHLRALQGIDEEQIKTNILTEVVACGVKKPPQLFTIDCLPMSEQEFTLNLQNRRKVIQHTSTFHPISTRDLQLAKTDTILAADRIAVATLEGEVAAHDKRLEELTTTANSSQEKVEQYSKRKESIKSEIQELEEQALALDTTEIVHGNTWSVRTKWKLLKKQSRSFELASKWPIQSVDYWTNGRCQWARREYATANCLHGVVRSKINRGLHARVALEVYKCDKYQEDITEMRESISSKKDTVCELEKQLAKNKKKHEQVIANLTFLREKIGEKRNKICKLSLDYLTIEECVERFQIPV